MNKLWIAACVLTAGCMHGGHGRGMMMMGGSDEGMGPGGQGMMGGGNQAWPSVRIDEPAGARVTMEPGIFGDGLDATTPFQGQFQTTGTLAMTGYPFEIHLDEATAQRYGGEHATVLYARLTVAASMKKEPVRIAPSECELRALITGEIDEVRVVAEQVPSIEERCALEEHNPPPPSHGMAAMCGGGPPQHMGCGGGCQHGGRHEGRCPHAHGHGGWHDASTVMKIRLAKF